MRKEAESLWAHHKYEVMFHSQKHYDLIRDTLKETDDTSEIGRLIKDALNVPPSKGSVLNVFDHMWGYFKKVCTDDEKEMYKKLKAEFTDSQNTEEDLLNFIKQQAEKYNTEYLLQSSILEKRSDS